MMTMSDAEIEAQQRQKIQEIEASLDQSKSQVVEYPIDDIKRKQWHESLTSYQLGMIAWVHSILGKYLEPFLEKFEFSFLCELRINDLLFRWIADCLRYQKFLLRSIVAEEEGEGNSFTCLLSEVTKDHLQSVCHSLILSSVDLPQTAKYLTPLGMQRLLDSLENWDLTEREQEMNKTVLGEEKNLGA